MREREVPSLYLFRRNFLLLLLLLASCPHQVGSPLRIALLHFVLSWASSGCGPAARRSFEMQSFHLLFGWPLLLLPVCSVLTLQPMSSRLSTLPNQRSLLSLIFPTNSPTFTLTLITAFSMRSSLVFPRENLNIFISATSIFLSWPLVTSTVSIPYSIAGRIIVLYILPFTATGTILSHRNKEWYHQCFWLQ